MCSLTLFNQIPGGRVGQKPWFFIKNQARWLTGLNQVIMDFMGFSIFLEDLASTQKSWRNVNKTQFSPTLMDF